MSYTGRESEDVAGDQSAALGIMQGVDGPLFTRARVIPTGSTIPMVLGDVAAQAASTAQYLNVKTFGAIGDGAHDDGPNIQNAINYASSTRGDIIFFPAGAYKYTTALDLKSNITLQGPGRHFGIGLYPTGCAAFRIEGADKPGGWVFRIKIRDMLIVATNADPAVPVVKMHSAYNVDLENIFFYDCFGQAIVLTSTNDIVLRDIIVYANNSGVAASGMIQCDGLSDGPVSAKIISPDIENGSRGIRSTGTVNLDIITPYSERCVVCYSHETLGGQTNIYGGVLSSVNGYGLYVYGDNLNVYGTDVDPFQGAVRGGLGIYTPGSGIALYRNNKYYGIPRMGQTGFLDYASLNLLAFQSDVSHVPGLVYRKIDIVPKTNLATGTPVNLFQTDRIDWAECKMRVHALGSLGSMQIVDFDFIIQGNTLFSNVTTSTVLNQTVGGQSIAWAATLTATATGVNVSVTPTITGGGTVNTLHATLNMSVTDSSLADVLLL